MSAPFCTGCGATIAAGTRFCVRCGQPIGQTAPSPAVVQTAPPPPPQAPPFPAPPAVKQGSGIGIWIGIFGVLLLLIGGAGFWFYAARVARSHAASAIQMAAQPAAPPSEPVPVPVAATTPEVAPPSPETAAPEAPPPSPDIAAKDQAPPKPRKAAPRAQVAPVEAPTVQATPLQTRPADPAPPPPAAPPPQPARPASPTSGTLHAVVEVMQNGEVVFANLPAGRLRFSFDHDAWQPTIHREANGTQTLVMRSLKPGIQRTCDVRWEIIQ